MRFVNGWLTKEGHRHLTQYMINVMFVETSKFVTCCLNKSHKSISNVGKQVSVNSEIELKISHHHQNDT